MRQRLKRILPRDNLCTTDDGEAIQHLQGTAVVWRYERVRGNFDAKSIPFVDVMFKYLNDLDEPEGFGVIPIGISRLGSFRLGTIWQNGKCIAETDLGNDQVFTVDFTQDMWSYLSLTGNPDKPSLQKTPVPDSVRKAEVLTDMLSFPLSGGRTLLIPCIEFLVRCYGSTPDIARTLATHPWSKVQAYLYAAVDLNHESWLVQPSRYVHDDDALLLASMLYDPYAQRAAKEIYAQRDYALGNGLEAVSLQVRPWFQGYAKIRVRGRWLENRKTFVCYEVTGLSEPQSHPYEIRRPKYSIKAPHGEIVTAIHRPHVEVPKPEDPFQITDRQEPDRGAAEWRKSDPGFETIGPKCRFTRSTEERTYSQRKVVTVTPSAKPAHSTGDNVGTNKDVGKLKHVARRFMGDGGVLNAMWMELTRLKNTQTGFSSLEWYSHKRFHQESTFRLHPLSQFHEDDSPKDDARRWLAFKENATRLRGLLVVRAVINGRSFYIFEAQRKKVRHGKEYGEESSYGLLMEISDPALALEEISNICDKIRFCSGKFLALENLDLPHYWVFRHITRKGVFYANATLRSAFARMKVELKRGGPDPVPGENRSLDHT